MLSRGWVLVILGTSRLIAVVPMIDPVEGPHEQLYTNLCSHPERYSACTSMQMHFARIGFNKANNSVTRFLTQVW